jgi:hypothetical protein
MNIKALNSALIKSMLSIAYNAKKYQGANIKEKINEAVEDLASEYKNAAGPEIPTVDDIDLSNVKIIKENE